MRAIQSPSTDPRFNLALEQYIFDQMPRNRSYLMLWRNDRTIVVGKHQDTFAEINADYVRANQIQVVRRLSGGGAVYHDLGNVNFTFIADHTGSDFDFSTFCRPVIWALESLGVPAELNGRNDMTIRGRKFSGNSQYVKEGRVMHHGTLLSAGSQPGQADLQGSALGAQPGHQHQAIYASADAHRILHGAAVVLPGRGM